MKFHIYEQGKAGGPVGTYDAATEEEAEDAHARALGYTDSVNRVFNLECAPTLYVIPAAQ